VNHCTKGENKMKEEYEGFIDSWEDYIGAEEISSVETI
jgi:hypothetical protein